VPCGLVNTVAGGFDLAARVGLDVVVRLAGAASVASPIGLSQTPVEYRLPPPQLGEHNADVQNWLADSAGPAEKTESQSAPADSTGAPCLG
jgi:crotonobetainyl-CoA:carnitine CoA-transferase CaiB-like acyl-CoA transferase